MLKNGDDLPKLFRSLGSSVADSRSAAGNASHDAEQRWPLLKAMPPKEPPPAPLLTARDKQNWQSHEQDAPSRPILAPAPASLGDRLALSLKEMSAHAKTEQSPKKTRAKPAVAATAPDQTLFTAPSMPKVPLAVLAGSPQDAGKPARSGKKPVATGSKEESDLGTMWGKKEPAAALPTSDQSRLDDSLKSVFGRLEPIQKEIKPPAVEKRPSYLGRLGRK